MAFVFEPVPPRVPKAPISFERARSRLDSKLRTELGRFTQQGRDMRHIKRLSPTETVFIIYYGTVEATLAKVVRRAQQSLKAAAELMFAAILKAQSINNFGEHTKSATRGLAAARARRWKEGG